MKRRLSILLLVTVALAVAALVACESPLEFEVTPTPTRTPRPTETPTPVPTPTPAWPVSVGCEASVPLEACAGLRERVAADSAHFVWSDDAALADVVLSSGEVPQSQPAGTWVYVLAAPFFTFDDEAALADLHAIWRGESARPLLMTADTLAGLTALWPPPTGEAVRVVVDDVALIDEAVAADGWAIVPFHQLEPRWKVLRVDGRSPLERDLELVEYALALPLRLGSGTRPEAVGMLMPEPNAFSNRDEEQMAVVIMTGVTALSRTTGRRMDQHGTTYPAQDVGDWLRDADLTHISNEVSFTPNCPEVLPSGTLVFCSREHYIELLEAIEVDIVELTGNHNNDYGTGPFLHTLEMYRQRGWRWFGGGADLADATRPLTVTLGPNRLVFMGCNPVGPQYAWATENSPGAAPCDWERITSQIAALRAEGWLPIFTVQAYETYEYFPTAGQVSAFRMLAEAGAVIVQGSQAHQPQGFEFHAGSFIHYGLGNLFFDQMWSLGTRQNFIDRHVFYDGRHISTELLTTMLEDYARPRPMTPAERLELLSATFAVSEWGR